MSPPTTLSPCSAASSHPRRSASYALSTTNGAQALGTWSASTSVLIPVRGIPQCGHCRGRVLDIMTSGNSPHCVGLDANIGDNVREYPNGNTPFLDSIAEHGVLVPLTAIRRPDGAVEVATGRAAPCRPASSVMVPVYVSPATAADTAAETIDRIVAMQMVTNDHKRDLTDAQRARGIQQMIDAGRPEEIVAGQRHRQSRADRHLQRRPCKRWRAGRSTLRGCLLTEFGTRRRRTARPARRRRWHTAISTTWSPSCAPSGPAPRPTPKPSPTTPSAASPSRRRRPMGLETGPSCCCATWRATATTANPWQPRRIGDHRPAALCVEAVTELDADGNATAEGDIDWDTEPDAAAEGRAPPRRFRGGAHRLRSRVVLLNPEAAGVRISETCNAEYFAWDRSTQSRTSTGDLDSDASGADRRLCPAHAHKPNKPRPKSAERRIVVNLNKLGAAASSSPCCWPARPFPKALYSRIGRRQLHAHQHNEPPTRSPPTRHRRGRGARGGQRTCLQAATTVPW